MQIHELKPDTKRSTKKTVGRGGLRGKTSGRGHKGQKARAGNSIRPELRDIIKKIPKLRGYRFNSFRPQPHVVNVSDLENLFQSGDTVSPKTLAQTGLISARKSTTSVIKILGSGDLTKKLTIEGCVLSAGAREKITSAGGSITE